MMLRSRRARPIYRIYTEADYLEAGADPFADWQATMGELAAESTGLGAAAGEPVAGLARLSTPRGRVDRDRAACERRLRRLAGAAALTGAVGTVGVLLGSALVGGSSNGRLAASAADRLETSTRMAGTATLPLQHAHSSMSRAREVAVGAGRAGTRGRGVAGQIRVMAKRAKIADRSGRSRTPRAASAVTDRSVVVSVASASQSGAQSVPAQSGYAGARGEFGFER